MAEMDVHGPQIMYKSKAYYGSDVVKSIPDNMYKLPNLMLSKNEQRKDTSVDNNPVTALERKQDKIIQRLSELKGVLNQLSSKYGAETGPNTSTSSTSSTMAVSGGVIHDMVISADPENPPLIVFILYSLLKEKCKVYGSVFVHSTAGHVPDRLRNLFKDQTNNNSRQDHQVALTVIWKKVKNGPTLVVSPHNQTAICGEVNIARYIMRLMNPDFDSTDLVSATLIDDWLDSAQQQLHQGSSKEKAASMKALNARLGRNDWLVGSSMSLADMVVWAALHQNNEVSSAPANVKKWLLSCDNSSVFQFVRTLLNEN